MKKFAIATILAVSAISASAVEVGVTTTTDYSARDANQGFGVTVGQQYGAVNLTAGYQRFNTEQNDLNRYSLTAGYTVAKLGPVTITPNIGVAYLDNQRVSDGYSMSVGVAASVPVAKNVGFVVNASRQYGQQRVSTFDGNAITAGLKYVF